MKKNFIVQYRLWENKSHPALGLYRSIRLYGFDNVEHAANHIRTVVDPGCHSIQITEIVGMTVSFDTPDWTKPENQERNNRRLILDYGPWEQ